VNIGMEVVAEPRILFLDEPTSGLDSTSSQEVLLALKEFAVKDDMTIVTVIHQPRLEIYNLLDELLLLGKGGKTVYIGPREEAEVYFAGLGFECADPHMNPIDFFMDIISGDVPRQGYPDFVKEDLFDEWIKYADTNRGSEVETEQTSNPLPEMGSDPSAGQGAGGTEALQTKEGAATNEDVEVEMKGNTDEQVMAEDEPGKDEPNCCAKCCGAICNGLAETCTDIKNWWTDFFVFLYNCFIAPWKPSYRVTPSAPYVFWKVMQRSLRQQYRDFGSFIGENVLHLVLGLFMGALSSEGVKLVGPIPPKAVDTCPYTLSGACNNPLVDDYPGVAGFLCWAVGFAGIAVGAGTFGNEKPQFWREQGAGMNFITYFYGKVLADVPKVAFAAACFCFAMLAGFATNSSAIKVYAVVFVMYYAGFSLGYLVSAFASREMSALLGVAISMLFAIQLSGTTSPKLKDIDDPDGITFGKIIFFLSYARWGTEAFYINEVTEYEYMNIGPYVASKGYKLGDSQFSKDILNCFLGSLFWQVIALVFLKMNNRQAQK